MRRRLRSGARIAFRAGPSAHDFIASVIEAERYNDLSITVQTGMARLHVNAPRSSYNNLAGIASPLSRSRTLTWLADKCGTKLFLLL